MLKITSRTALTVVAAALVALLLAHGALAAGGSVSIAPPTVEVTSGASAPVDVAATAPDGDLGYWDLQVIYDTQVARFTACSGISFCSEAVPGTVRVVGFSAGGLAGQPTLATLTLEAIGAPGQSTALHVNVLDFATALGDPQQPQVSDGVFSVRATANALWGDVDCAGSVNIADAQKVNRALIGLTPAQNEPCPDIGSTVQVPA